MARRPRGCRDAERLILRSLDSDLTAEERERLDAHCAACTACAHGWEEYRRLARAATEWVRRPSVSAPTGDFTASVLDQIARRQDAGERALTGRGSPWLAWIAGLACTVAAVAAWHYLPLSVPLQPPTVASFVPPPAQVVSISDWLRESTSALPDDAQSLMRSLFAMGGDYNAGLIALGAAAVLALCLLGA